MTLPVSHPDRLVHPTGIDVEGSAAQAMLLCDRRLFQVSLPSVGDTSFHRVCM
jgi:hypothetical protein